MGAWKSCVHACLSQSRHAQAALWLYFQLMISFDFMSMTLAKVGGLSGMQAVTHYEYELLWYDDHTELEQSLHTRFCTYY